MSATAAFRASRIFTEAAPGVMNVTATFSAGDSSMTRTFATPFEADAWLDAKRIGHMTREISAEANAKTDRIVAIATQAGITLHDWQINLIRRLLAAGPEAPSLVATSDRRETHNDRRETHNDRRETHNDRRETHNDRREMGTDSNPAAQNDRQTTFIDVAAIEAAIDVASDCGCVVAEYGDERPIDDRTMRAIITAYSAAQSPVEVA